MESSVGGVCLLGFFNLRFQLDVVVGLWLDSNLVFICLWCDMMCLKCVEVSSWCLLQ